MYEELLRASAPILRRQHALISREQVLGTGASDSCLRFLLRRGVWQPVDRALYGPAGVPMSWRRRLKAATMIAPPGSLISHLCGAALTGVGGLHEPTPEISIPRGAKLRRPWLRTHESLDLALADRVVVDGIPTTGPCRLAVDLGGRMSFDRFKHTIRELRHGHGVSQQQLLRTYLRHKRQGRTGCGALRDWLDRYFAVDGISESGLELVVLDAILDASLPTPVRQHWVEVGGRHFRLDLAYPGACIVIEVDGRQHNDLDIAEADAARTALLEAAGWRVIRVRSWCLATDLQRALGLLHDLL